MPFKKGDKKPPNSGRRKGSANKNTQSIRDAFQKLLEDNLPNYAKWLEQIAEENPEKAIRLLNDMSEYILPKLQRTEHSGVDGDPIEQILKIKQPKK